MRGLICRAMMYGLCYLAGSLLLEKDRSKCFIRPVVCWFSSQQCGPHTNKLTGYKSSVVFFQRMYTFQKGHTVHCMNWQNFYIAWRLYYSWMLNNMSSMITFIYNLAWDYYHGSLCFMSLLSLSSVSVLYCHERQKCRSNIFRYIRWIKLISYKKNTFMWLCTI